MTRPLGSLDFFALEAGDCLSRIEQLVAAFETPPAEELLRAARALRGAAVLAQHAEIADAAAGFEAVGRALVRGLAWSDERRQRTHDAVEAFRLVIRSVAHWSDGDAERARGIGRTLREIAGEAAPAPSAAAAASGTLPAGVRAFIAREGALVASALAEAARRVADAPDDVSVLQPTAKRLLALRGVGELRELAPLPDLLDAIELLADDLPRLGAPPATLGTIADAAAAALARICRDVAGPGRPAPESPDARHVITLIFEAAAVERDVVPIASLLAGDAVPPLVPENDGRPPMGALALVSLGEHLTQAADVLARTPRAAQRELRAYAALAAIRRTATLGGAPAHGLRALLRAVRAALADGLLRHDAPRLAAVLREASGLLRQVSDLTDRHTLSRQLAAAAMRLEPAPPPATEPEPEPVRAATAPHAALVEDDDPIVPIEMLLLETPEPPAAIPVPADDRVVPMADLLAARATATTSADGGDALPMAALLAATPAASAAPMPPALAPSPPAEDLLVSSWLAYERAAPPLLRDTEPVPVPIESLLYRGTAALARARDVRSALLDRLGHPDPDGAAEALIRELCDLVALAADAD